MEPEAAEPVVEHGYCPGLIGRISVLHARYYAEAWGFGAFFEARVAGDLAAFVARYDPGHDRIWRVMLDGEVEGSLVIDGHEADDAGAHLRWFILSDRLRGHGLGARLVDAAMDFCRDCGHRRVYLWTFDGLDAARALYERAGFRLVSEAGGTQWGTPVTEQRFEVDLG